MSFPQAARTAALAATLLFTGARISELLGADIEDLGIDRGHRVLRVCRKGGKIQACGTGPGAMYRARFAPCDGGVPPGHGGRRPDREQIAHRGLPRGLGPGRRRRPGWG